MLFTYRKFNIKMSMKDYMGVLWACANVDTSNNNHANIVKCKLAYMVYNTLKVEKNIPTDVFIKMMNICAKLGHGSTASMLYREFCSYGYKSSDSFMQDYVIAMARAVQVSWGQHSYDRANIGSSRDAFQEACATYRKLGNICICVCSDVCSNLCSDVYVVVCVYMLVTQPNRIFALFYYVNY